MCNCCFDCMVCIYEVGGKGDGMCVLIVKVLLFGDVVYCMLVVVDILCVYLDVEIDWVVEEGFVGIVCIVCGVQGVILFVL